MYETCHTDSQSPAGKYEVSINEGSNYVTPVSREVYKTRKRDGGRHKGYAQGLLH